MIELVLSQAEECRPLRQAVLRPGQPAEACCYPQDDDARTIHFTLKQGKAAVGAVSMYHQPRAELGSEVWRVRGMAVLPDFRRQGLGHKLLAAVQAVAAKRGGGMWGNVRSEAVPFYAAHGFQGLGEEFDLPDLGPHLLMTWRPKP